MYTSICIYFGLFFTQQTLYTYVATVNVIGLIYVTTTNVI